MCGPLFRLRECILVRLVHRDQKRPLSVTPVSTSMQDSRVASFKQWERGSQKSNWKVPCDSGFWRKNQHLQSDPTRSARRPMDTNRHKKTEGELRRGRAGRRERALAHEEVIETPKKVRLPAVVVERILNLHEKQDQRTGTNREPRQPFHNHTIRTEKRPKRRARSCPSRGGIQVRNHISLHTSQERVRKYKH